jgi:autotransporter-associated beta strand protein
MKPDRSNPLFAGFFRKNLLASSVVLSFCLGTAAHSQTLYWDASDAAGSGNTSGTWDSGTNWTTDSSGVTTPRVGWTNGQAAVFSAGTDGTGAWSVAIVDTVTTPSILVEESGAKTISGGTINIGGGTINTAAAGNGNTFTITSAIAGSGGLSVAANGDTSASGGGVGGRLVLSGTNTFTGDLTITSGLVRANSNFGDAGNKVILNGGGLLDDNQNINFTRNIQVDAAGGVYRTYGSVTTGQISGAITGSGILRRTDGGTLTLVGNGSGFNGEFFNQRGALRLGTTGNWANASFRSEDASSGLRFLTGVSEYRIKEYFGDRDINIEAGVTLNIVGGNFNVTNGDAVNNFWVQNSGSLTSESNTLTCNWGTTDYVTATDRAIRVIIKDYTVGSPLTLVKNQVGGLILDKVNTYSGGTTINAGRITASSTGALGTNTVTVNNGGQAYLATSGTFANNFIINGNGSTEGSNQFGAIRFENNTVSGSIQVATAARITAHNGSTGTHTGALTGTGNLEINSNAASNNGTVNLNGNSTGYSGTLSIIQGVVNINSSAFGGSVQVNSTGSPFIGRANLGADTTVSGSVTVSDIAKIGGEGTITGTLAIGNTTGADIHIDAATTDVLTAGTLDIKGDNFVFIDRRPTAPGSFPILKYTTLAGGDETNFTVQMNARDGSPAVVAHDTVNKQFTVDLGNASRTWDNGTASSIWNILDANWAEGDGLFVDGDSVTFSDTPGSNQTISLPSNVAPGSISFSNSTAVSYSINGTGAITGSTGISKSGTGTASLGGTGNTYTGTVTITGGTLRALSTTALGATSAGTIVNGGTLDLNGINVGNEAISIQGTGAAGLAALYNGVATNASIGTLTLTGDATVGCAANTFASAIDTTGITLGSNKLTLGGGYLRMAGGDAFVGSGSVEVGSGGVLFIGNNTTGAGTAAISIKSGGAISFRDYNNTGLANVPAITLDGGTISNGGIDQGNGVGNGGGAQTNFKNALTVTSNGGTLNPNNTGFGLNMIHSGTLSGTGALQLNGGRGMDFRGDVSGYSGTINVNTGQPLIFNGNAAQTFSGGISQTGTRTLWKEGANLLTFSGATVNISTFQVRTSTGTEHVAISSGTITASYFDLGAGANGNYARVSQTGGTVTATAGGFGFRLGHWNTGGGGSTYNLSGGTLDASGLAANATASDRVVNIGWDGLAAMTVGGGAGTATLRAFGVQLDANTDSTGYNNSLTLSNNGVLEIGAGNIAGASVNDGLFLNGGTILATAATTLSAQTTLNPSTSSFIDTDIHSITWSGPIAGSGSFDKSGTGTLTMTAGGAFSGTATASEGRLHTGTATWSDATFASVTTGILQPSTAAASGTSTVKNLTLNGGTAAFRAKPTGGDQFTVTGNLTVESPSTLVVDTSGLTVGQQAVLIDYTGSIGGTAGYAGLSLVPTNPRALITKVHDTGDTRILASLDSVDSIVWSGASDSNWDLNTTSNWVLSSNNGTSAKFLNLDVVRFTNFGVTLRPNVTLVGTINPSSVEVSNTTGTYQLSGAAITGNGGLTKTGSGGLILAASNTYTGTTVIGGGSVTASATNALGAGATTLNSGTLNLNHASALGSGVLTIAGGAIGNTSGSPVTLATNNAQSWTGDFVCNAAHALNLGTGPVTLGATRQIFVTSADLTVGGVISGTGFGITKAGSGKLVLTGASNYTGATAVNEGTLEVSANSGSKTYTVAENATLRIGYSTGGADYGFGITVNGSGTASPAGLYIEGGDSLVLQSTLTLATAPSTVRSYGTGTGTLRGWDVNGTHLSVQAAASGSVIDTGVTLNGSGYGYRMSVAAGSATATGDLVIDGPMPGSAVAGFANFRKHGSGSVRINSAATYAAGMDIRGGSVILGGSNRLPTGSYVALGDGSASGVLKLNGNSQTLASISTTGTGTANAIVGGAPTASTLTVSNTAAVTYAGSLGGPGADENNLNLVKEGAETLTLTGVSTFTGNTSVNTGTLNLADNARLTFRLGATSGANNTLTGAGTVVLEGDFAIDTTAADGLTSGTWVLENVSSLTGPYGINFQVVNTDGSPWTDNGGEQWTKPGANPGQTWTFNETTGTLTLATVAGGYDSWATQITNGKDGRAEDADDDGFTNLQEFLFGTSPIANNGSLTTTERTGPSTLLIRWSERLAGADYTLLESGTLSNPWTPSAAPVTTDGSPVGDYQPMKATVTIGAGPMFFRVEGAETP